MQVLLDMLKGSMMIHTIHIMNPRYSSPAWAYLAKVLDERLCQLVPKKIITKFRQNKILSRSFQVQYSIV
jgi:hypothetical protein